MGWDYLDISLTFLHHNCLSLTTESSEQKSTLDTHRLEDLLLSHAQSLHREEVVITEATPGDSGVVRIDRVIHPVLYEPDTST